MLINLSTICRRPKTLNTAQWRAPRSAVRGAPPRGRGVSRQSGSYRRALARRRCRGRALPPAPAVDQRRQPLPQARQEPARRGRARRRGEETSDDPPLPGPSTSPPDLAWRVAHRVEPLTMFTPNVLHIVCACPCAQDEGHNTPVHRGRSRLARRSHGQGRPQHRRHPAPCSARLCSSPRSYSEAEALTPRDLDPKRASGPGA